MSNFLQKVVAHYGLEARLLSWLTGSTGVGMAEHGGGEGGCRPVREEREREKVPEMGAGTLRNRAKKGRNWLKTRSGPMTQWGPPPRAPGWPMAMSRGLTELRETLG